MVIDVDGTTEEMHQKYRRGTSLKKSLSALKALSTTKAIPLSQTVVFKHNEMYVEQIKNLAIESGSHNHISYPSDRFDFLHGDLNTFNFINEDGNKETLERAVHVKNYM
jgi:MoaA/NifB/PqqE/SkfB family radical SAM enzyme